ncbi:MAG: hypothetical protein H7Z11_02510 [Verrucomicrobia bacterium]|nr:hypothetical protein [Leptolyngbya sp. ES-bin-22]
MKPNYDAMSWSELRAYILSHRDDLDALEALYARRSPDSEATWYTPPKTEEEWQQQMEMVKPILERKPKANE